MPWVCVKRLAGVRACCWLPWRATLSCLCAHTKADCTIVHGNTQGTYQTQLTTPPPPTQPITHLPKQRKMATNDSIRSTFGYTVPAHHDTLEVLFTEDERPTAAPRAIPPFSHARSALRLGGFSSEVSCLLRTHFGPGLGLSK